VTEVVGGTYSEVVVDPPFQRVVGSGLRAAIELGEECTRFHTSVSANDIAARATLASLLGDRWVSTDRSGRVEFTYRTPVSRSAMAGGEGATFSLPVRLDGGDAVLFGMVECDATVVGADRLVIDPQGSMSVDAIAACSADRICVVLNRHEVRAAAGAVGLGDAARQLREQLGCEAVVVKCGAAGALVCDSSGESVVGAVPSPRVWPVGSGDTFTSAFAAAWFAGATPREAIVAASKRTSVAVDAAHVASTTEVASPSFAWSASGACFDDPPTVYLAAAFETTAQRWLVDEVRSALRDVGVGVFSPLHDVGVVGDDPTAHVRRDLDGVVSCDAMLVLSDSCGRGTFVEAGVALNTGVPLVVLAERVADWQHTVLRGAGASFTRDLATSVYWAAWAALAAKYPL
jgi:nucleoside 2-deoxyribosyltransferase